MEKIFKGGKAKIKSKKTDKGGTFYIFDLYDDDGKLVAVNRYSFESNTPFDALSKAEDCVVLKEKPDDKWLVADVKEYMDLKEIPYNKETKAELLALVNPEVKELEVLNVK